MSEGRGRPVTPPEIVTALVGLAALSLLPVAYKKYKARR